MTRVLIVASSAVVRAGLRSILTERGDLEPIGEVSQLGDDSEPDVVLIDLAGGDAAEVFLPWIESGGPPVVVLTPGLGGDDLARVLRQGAHGILPRDAAPEQIVAAVKAAALGLVVLPEGSAALLPLPAAPIGVASERGVEALTPREREVLALLAEGAGNKQIARRLGISEHTVKFHVGSILGKLGAGSRTEAVTMGLRLGLIMV